MENIFHWLTHGALKYGGTWGGPTCRAHVSNTIHFYEDIAWNMLAVFLGFAFGLPKYYKKLTAGIKEELKLNPVNSVTRPFEVLFACLHFTLYGMVIYYKINIQALIMIVQPCPMIVLLQGIALYDTGVLGVVITIFILPALIGALLATAVPDTSGLDQPFEYEAYFIQHYSILVMPFLLLTRRNFLALKFSNAMSVLTGLLILTVLHFAFFEAIDLALLVNVEFMLCPTNPMTDIFNMIERLYPTLSLLLYPSHRSTLCYVVLLAVWPVSYFYIGGSHIIKMVLGGGSVSSTRKDKKMK